MKSVAVGDIFITPDMMQNGFEEYSGHFGPCRYFYFGSNDRKDMRNTVKIIEAGRGAECQLPEGLMEAIVDAEVLMVHLCPVTETLISKAKKLKYILCNRGGMENIDIEAATKRGIWVITNPAHNANAVAEFTIGAIFCETRNFARAHYSMLQCEWREKYPNSGRIIEIKDLTVGIVGFGNIGELVCEKLRPFGCKILISTPREPDRKNPNIDWDKVKYVDFDTLIREADIVSIHVRSKEKKVLFGEREFKMMKPTAYLINTSRSYMVDTQALADALKEGQISGAAIDVFDREPLEKEHPLLGIDSITLTNHRAGDTLNAYKDSPAMMLGGLARWLDDGKIPKFLQNRGAI